MSRERDNRRNRNTHGRADLQRELNNRRRRRKRGLGVRIFLNLLMLIALGVLVFSVYQIVTTLLPYQQGRQLNQQIRDTYTSVEVAAPAEGGEGEEGVQEARERFVVDFEALLATNRDTVAWLRFIEPEIISYPVVRSHDNEEYLHRAFDGSYSQLGSIFLDMDSNPDFTDRNTIIYGHNMAVGGEMFSQLVEFSNIEFTRENPYFFIYTPDGVQRTYRIFMAATVGADSLIYRIQFLDDDDFLEYLELSRSISAYFIDEGDLHQGAKIVTLSTCTNVIATDRFIIQGVLVEERVQ